MAWERGRDLGKVFSSVKRGDYERASRRTIYGPPTAVDSQTRQSFSRANRSDVVGAINKLDRWVTQARNTSAHKHLK